MITKDIVFFVVRKFVFTVLSNAKSFAKKKINILINCTNLTNDFVFNRNSTNHLIFKDWFFAINDSLKFV